MGNEYTVPGVAAEYRCDIRPAPEGQEGFVAEFVDLPGCFAFGSSRQEAMNAGESALARWLERASELGITPPKPGSGQGANGIVRIRTLKSTHRKLALLANEVRLSLNEVVVQLCYRAVARDFDQAPAGKTELCSLVGPSRDVTRRPNGNRFDQNQEFSGTWVQRFPSPLHLGLVSWAQNEAVPINVLINYILVRELEAYKDRTREVMSPEMAA